MSEYHAWASTLTRDVPDGGSGLVSVSKMNCACGWTTREHRSVIAARHELDAHFAAAKKKAEHNWQLVVRPPTGRWGSRMEYEGRCPCGFTAIRDSEAVLRDDMADHIEVQEKLEAAKARLAADAKAAASPFIRYEFPRYEWAKSSTAATKDEQITKLKDDLARTEFALFLLDQFNIKANDAQLDWLVKISKGVR
jgi:hypothetical protein